MITQFAEVPEGIALWVDGAKHRPFEVINCNNHYFIPYFFLTKRERSLFPEIMGYDLGGCFPECRSYEDLIKYLRGIAEQVKQVYYEIP